MASSEIKQRPLTPHLSIYKPQISSTLSIFHRLTGMALYGAMLLSCWWFILVVFGDYKCMCECKLIKISAILVTFALFYHMANGVRHLFWDMGKGFELPIMRLTGFLVIIFALMATTAFWLI